MSNHTDFYGFSSNVALFDVSFLWPLAIRSTRSARSTWLTSPTQIRSCVRCTDARARTLILHTFFMICCCCCCSFNRNFSEACQWTVVHRGHRWILLSASNGPNPSCTPDEIQSTNGIYSPSLNTSTLLVWAANESDILADLIRCLSLNAHSLHLLALAKANKAVSQLRFQFPLSTHTYSNELILVF